MTDEILLVVCFIASLYEKGLCPDNVANAAGLILYFNDLWDEVISIKQEGGYEKYVDEHKCEL